ncbi:MAG TPA: peptidoglycan-binding domain-containing protein [Acidimicrobiia bacterium]|nr:peptidoglycan-binding domain-containing protein [Acidimicrobiia bacterium]
MQRRIALLIGLLLVATACGDDDAVTTVSSTAAGSTTTTVPETSTTTTTAATTTIAETTTTTAPPTGPLAGFLAAPVEDPFFGSGFHDVAATDDTNSRMVSADAVRDDDLLVLEPLDPEPILTGLGEGELLVTASIEGPSGEPAPTATVLYALGPNGWSVYTTVSDASVLTYLETTTDYQARGPSGAVVVVPTITRFDWAGRALFTADVAVYRDGEPDTPAFEAEIECTVTAEYECMLISDDGVLRPGDEGEAVEALQAQLGAIDYYDGVGDGTYDEDVTEAVRLFQRDYRLAQDGKAGPNTLRVLGEVATGESEIVMARPDRVGTVEFGVPAPTARAALVEIFGTPTADTGWYTDACDGSQWNKVSWAGFTAIFTDRSGTEIFDGWHVDDLSAVPTWLYFAGGIGPTTTWAGLQALGAGYEPGYGGFWYLDSPPYNNGRFTLDPGDQPPPDATIASFGTATGAFVSC